MSALTKTAGYPVHAVATFRRWTNPHGVTFTDWTAACGATGDTTGHRPLGTAGSARAKELCTACFPAGHQTNHPEPVEINEPAGVTR